MVLAGIKRDKPKHLFVGSSPVPRTTKKTLKIQWLQGFFVALKRLLPFILAAFTLIFSQI